MSTTSSQPSKVTPAGRPARRGGTVRRQLIALVLGILIPFLTLFVLRAHERARIEREAATERLRNRARVVAGAVDEHVARVQTLLVAASRTVGTSPADLPRNDSILVAIMHDLRDTVASSLWVLTPDGAIVGSSRRSAVAGRHFELSDRPYFRDVLRTRQPVVSQPLRGLPTGEWFVAFARPILRGDGEVAAVMLASVRLTLLAGVTARAIPDTEMLVTLVDSTGTILSRSLDPETWVGRNVSTSTDVHSFMARGAGVGQVTGLEGLPRLSGYARTSTLPWQVFVGTPRDLAFAPATRMFRRDLSLAAMAAVLAILISVAVARRLTRPLQELSDSALAMAGGDYRRRSRVSGAARELTALAESFDTMAATVEARTGELRDSELRYRSLFETSPLPMFVFARDTLHMLAVNEAATAQYGYTREEFLALRVTDLRPPETRARLEHMLRARDEVRDRGEPSNMGTWVHQRSDGSRLEVEVFTAMLDYEGRPARLYTAVDVTARRRAEQALADSQEQLRRVQKMEALGRFAGGIAHDFNNLLTGILGYCDLALEDIPAGTAARGDVAAIRSTAERAASLTRQILAFSRKQMLQPVLLDLNAVVGGMEDILGRLMENGVTVQLALAPGLGAVLADRSQLEQVILNLVLNARDAMPGGGTVRVETGELVVGPAAYPHRPGADGPGPGRWLVLAVRDSGVGMTAGMKSQILEPFFTTKERSKGTGLGLATVDGIVQQSGGVLQVESEPGSGSTFRVFLPRAAGDAGAAPQGTEAQPLQPGSGSIARTILLAEDEDAVRAVATAALRRAGHQVLAARDGGEAMELAASHGAPVDILITDVVMPGMMGPELAARLRDTQPGLRVLLTSGYTDDDHLLRALASEALPFIAKPFTPSQLLARVQAVLDGDPSPGDRTGDGAASETGGEASGEVTDGAGDRPQGQAGLAPGDTGG